MTSVEPSPLPAAGPSLELAFDVSRVCLSFALGQFYTIIRHPKESFSSGKSGEMPFSTAGNSLKLIETHWNSLKLIETHWNSLKLIETHWNSLKLIETPMICPWNIPSIGPECYCQWPAVAWPNLRPGGWGPMGGHPWDDWMGVTPMTQRKPPMTFSLITTKKYMRCKCDDPASWLDPVLRLSSSDYQHNNIVIPILMIYDWIVIMMSGLWVT